MYRLLAIDLDGTLLTPQKFITPRTQKALFQAAEMGITIVIATGQTFQVLRQVCAGLPLTAPQIIENGAIIADIQHGTVLHEQLLPAEYILPALDTLRSLGLYRVYHTFQCVYVDNNTPRARNWYRPPLSPPVEIADVASIYPQPCIKIVGVGEVETLREKRRELERIFDGTLYVTQSSPDLVELLHPAVSKGNALRAISCRGQSGSRLRNAEQCRGRRCRCDRRGGSAIPRMILSSMPTFSKMLAAGPVEELVCN